MVTLRGILIAIAVGCVLASTVMLVVMLLGSQRKPWHRRLDKGALAIGLFSIAFGALNFTMHRQAQREHRIRYYKRAPVSPAQGYAAAAGFVILGTLTVIIALVHGRSSTDHPPDPPTI